MARHQSVSLSDTEGEDSRKTRRMKLKLDAVLQTPVIVIPRTPESSEVLVAHLGKISLRNSPDANVLDETLSSKCRDRVYVEIRDMSMYSMDLDKQRLLQKEAAKDVSAVGASTFMTPLPGGGIQMSYGTPILHDTVLELTIHKGGLDENYVNPNTDGLEFTFADHKQLGGRLKEVEA